MIEPLYWLTITGANGLNKNVFICISILLIAFATVSCKSKSEANQVKPIEDTTGIIKLPPPKPLRTAEFNRIKIRCQQWYDSVFNYGNFNGGMLVAKSGNIIFEKYNGCGHIGQTDTINSNTANHIASVSKTFTAMGILKLVQDGKVQLDDELNKYFPDFKYPGVTVRDLLDHRSGLPNYLYFMDELGWDKKYAMTNQDVFNWLISKKAQIKDISKPNTHFTYCNTNYALLALLIEKLSGTPYPQFMRDSFFKPLQMKSSFVFTPADSARINLSYDWRGGLIPLNFLDAVYGDKNIYTTPRDLLRWDRALSTNLIFNQDILQQAYSPYSNERPGIRNYGLGWRMNIYPDGKKLIFHNGWWHGSNAVFIRMIDEDAVIILIGNKYSRGIYKAKYLVNLFNPSLSQEEEEEEGK
ncbi:MAG: serine hydrolase domain-containing protein [Ferruginibacter sp.]